MSGNQSLLEDTIKARGNTQDNKPRRLGVEIEFAGLSGEEIVNELKRHFGGCVEHLSPFESELRDSEFGTFKVELDSNQVKDFGEKAEEFLQSAEVERADLQKKFFETVGSLAGALVPWEIVAPPIPFKDLPRLYQLIEDLRDSGASGTRLAPHYAFGVHLNPELPALDVNTILRYLQAYCCLYDWIKETEKTDLSRRITPYINHFSKEYVSKILAPDYAPSLEELIDDYLEFNPTRNRSLDMLPLFQYLDKERIDAVIDDERVKPRPTFHYRLPNCDIDDPGWNLDNSLDTWLQVEQLAFDKKLSEIATEYQGILNEGTTKPSEPWAERVAHLLGITTPSSLH